MLEARLSAYLLVHGDAWAAGSTSLTAVQVKRVSVLRSVWDKPLLILSSSSAQQAASCTRSQGLQEAQGFSELPEIQRGICAAT